MEEVLIGLAAILVVGVCAEWLAWWLRLPSIVLLLAFGFLAGPVTGVLVPDELLGELLLPVVSLAVGIILFEGGLNLRLRELREIGGAVGNLVTIGALVTWLLSALLAHLIAGLGWDVALLLGAVFTVSGPTVIIPLLRQIRPRARVASTLKWEGILIDPIGALLVVLVFEAIRAEEIPAMTLAVLGGIFRPFVVGGVLGIAGGLFIGTLLLRHWVPDYLQNPFALAVVMAVFTGANLLQAESGLVATVVMGMTVANWREVPTRHLAEFKENLQVLFIMFLFIVLAARLDLDRLVAVGYEGIVFLAGLVLAVRPLAVALSTIGSNLDWRERLLVAGVAPRGVVAAAVSSVFALRLVGEGRPGAELVVPLTFLVIFGTGVVYGIGAPWLAFRLGLAERDPQGFLVVGANLFARSLAKALQDHGIKVLLADTNAKNLAEARAAGLPTFHHNVLAEHAWDEMNLDGIGRLLALTPNNEVNSLTAMHFSEVFPRAEVYQLSPGRTAVDGGEIDPGLLHGRFLFGWELDAATLRHRLTHGAEIRTIPVQDDNDLQVPEKGSGESVTPLVAVGPGNKAEVFTTETRPPARRARTLVCLVEPGEPTADEDQPSPG